MRGTPSNPKALQGSTLGDCETGSSPTYDPSPTRAKRPQRHPEQAADAITCRPDCRKASLQARISDGAGPLEIGPIGRAHRSDGLVDPDARSYSVGRKMVGAGFGRYCLYKTTSDTSGVRDSPNGPPICRDSCHGQSTQLRESHITVEGRCDAVAETARSGSADIGSGLVLRRDRGGGGTAGHGCGPFAAQAGKVFHRDSTGVATARRQRRCCTRPNGCC